MARPLSRIRPQPHEILSVVVRQIETKHIKAPSCIFRSQARIVAKSKRRLLVIEFDYIVSAVTADTLNRDYQINLLVGDESQVGPRNIVATDENAEGFS